MDHPLVLIVDDEPTILELLAEALGDEGYMVEVAPDIATATASVAHAQPACIILDLIMEKPDSGWQWIQELRADPSTHALPVVFFTVNAKFLESHAGEIAAANCRAVPKPFDLAEMISTVAALAPLSA